MALKNLKMVTFPLIYWVTCGIYFMEKVNKFDIFFLKQFLKFVRAQDWSNIFELVAPFPSVAPLNITQALIDKEFDAKKIHQSSEDFYKSIGKFGIFF